MSRKGRNKRKKSSNPQGATSQASVGEQLQRMQKRKRIRTVAIILIAIVVPASIFAAIFFYAFATGCPDGIPELGVSDIVIHIHEHLDIFVNGTPVMVPDTLGHIGGTFCALHTHDTTGVIHDESPTTRTYTVQEIFDVWGYTVPSGAKVYVNGNLDTFSHVLVAHDEIAVVIGTPPPTIPSSYNFPAGA